jgi:flagellar hook-associated protein 2
MASISSIGIGSGLDASSIISQLVALEKQPLKVLQTKATLGQAQLSSFATIQSGFAALGEVAARLSSATGWSARVASSSNTSAASITATDVAAANSFTLDIDVLAKAQSVSSTSQALGSLVGAGTLTFRVGTWSGGTSFAPGAGSDVPVTVTAQDTMTTLAAKINAANAGVVATVFKDGTGERLLFRSKETGLASGFRVQATDVDGNNTDNAGLSSLAYDPQTGAFGMASPGTPVQFGQDAQVRINGLAVTSASNTLTDNFPGVTITLTATTTTGYGTPGEVKSPATMAIREDVTPAVKNVQDFITAYNTLSTALAEMTKYDAATKTPSIFQGDSAVLGLQSVLRNMLSSISSGSAYKRLSDIGIERQLDGKLTMNTAKLSAAANNGTELQKLFITDNKNAQTNGFALKFSALAKGVLATGGSVTNKAQALQKQLDRNATEQTKVNDRATVVEARLKKQYTTLDTKMASLTALNNYVAQQISQWNKSTD